jgi:hypothetical protein
VYLHGRSGQAVSVKELGLGLSAVAALTIPPASTVAIKDTASGTGNGDGCTGNTDKRTSPLLVAKGSGALEDDVSSALQPSQVEGSAGRDGDVVEDDSGAGSLRLSGRSSTASTTEGAGCGALLDRRGSGSSGDHGSTANGSGCDERREVHVERLL